MVRYLRYKPFYLLFFSIDGTHERRRLLIFANDSVPKDANCKACRVETLEDTTRPCIITKRDIAKGEEITYSYGDYAYEWRVKKSESATGVEIETPPAPPGNAELLMYRKNVLVK